MNIMEIVLLVIGILVFVASFLIPNGKGDNLAHDREMARDEIGDLVARELERIRSQVDDTVEEAIKDSMDKTERSLEKLSNEKIMAVSEYSETVLGQINKSQQEILFLYDMLNAKHDNLKNTASEVEQRVKEAEMALRETEAAAQMARQMVAPAFQAMQDGEETASAEQETGEEIVEEPQQELQGTESYSNKNQQILELHRQGHSEVAIARQLDLGVGEVKLVIDLFEGRND